MENPYNLSIPYFLSFELKTKLRTLRDRYSVVRPFNTHEGVTILLLTLMDWVKVKSIGNEDVDCICRSYFLSILFILMLTIPIFTHDSLFF